MSPKKVDSGVFEAVQTMNTVSSMFETFMDELKKNMGAFTSTVTELQNLKTKIDVNKDALGIAKIEETLHSLEVLVKGNNNSVGLLVRVSLLEERTNNLKDSIDALREEFQAGIHSLKSSYCNQQDKCREEFRELNNKVGNQNTSLATIQGSSSAVSEHSRGKWQLYAAMLTGLAGLITAIVSVLLKSS